MIWLDTKELRAATEAVIVAGRMARDEHGLRVMTNIDHAMAFRAVKGVLAMLLDAPVVEEGTDCLDATTRKQWP